jgi:hypothetical protein
MLHANPPVCHVNGPPHPLQHIPEDGSCSRHMAAHSVGQA